VEKASSPLATVIAVHGAGSDPSVFDDWADVFPTARIVAPDLQHGLAVDRASMADYRDRVLADVAGAKRPIALVGWSMGGLIALMAAKEADPDLVVLLEPSPPAEVQGVDPDVALASGTFDPETAYGAFPAGMSKREESILARSERKRGISVPQLTGPALVVSSEEFGDGRGLAIARRYGATFLEFPGLSHWDLVLSPEVRRAIAAWISDPVAVPAESWLLETVQIRSSTIHGDGLFAAEPIAEGTIAERLGGRILTNADVATVTDRGERYDGIGLASGLSLQILPTDWPGIHGNHSCDPNLWMADAVTLSARRDIRQGEEMTVDYAMFTASSSWSMPCRCGSAPCRGVIRGTDWQRTELQERYRGHLAPFIQRLIRLETQR
jgi:hypothetical protein